MSGVVSSTVLDIARVAYRDIRPYAPVYADGRVITLDLSDNINLWGAPPAALAAITAGAASVSAYPPLALDDLNAAIAGSQGVTADMIVTGCGSDDVIDSAFRSFGDPGDVVAHPAPSFSMIPVFARMNALVSAPVMLTPELDVDVGAFVRMNAKITYLCSPNNPTGSLFSRAAIEEIAASVDGVVMIDEAYAEFAGVTCADLIARNPRVLVTRTMSKAYGLAGLRLGYAIGDPDVVAEVGKSRGPYKVSSLAARAGTAALTEGRAWVDARVRDAVNSRERLWEALRGMGLAPLPSDANFVLVPVSDALWLSSRLRARGIAVRAFGGLPVIGDALRISVGPWELMERCIAALGEIVERAS